MSLRIKHGRPMDQEIRRLFQKHLVAAIACLTAGSGTSWQRVHDARRCVKKASAILHLVHAPLGKDYHRANRTLARVSRLLGQLTDADRVLQTLDAIREPDARRWPPAAVQRLRGHLAARASAIQQRAAFARLRERIVRLLQVTADRSARWSLSALDPAAVARGVRTIHRAARAARRAAAAAPTVEAYHDWRRRVKVDWYAFRLIATCSGERLINEQRRLEALDGCLGRLHDIEVLKDVIVQESPLSREETAACVATLRRVARELRREAAVRGRALNERPRDVEARVLTLWGSSPVRRADAGTEQPWPRLA